MVVVKAAAVKALLFEQVVIHRLQFVCGGGVFLQVGLNGLDHLLDGSEIGFDVNLLFVDLGDQQAGLKQVDRLGRQGLLDLLSDGTDTNIVGQLA